MAEPQSLWQLLGGGGNFRNALGEEDPKLGFGDALAQRQNSLIGMGGALLSGGGWGGAMQGYAQGAQQDANLGYRLAQMKQHQQELAARQKQQAEEFGFRKSEAQRQADQWQQTFQRGGESEFDRMQRDLAKYRGTPQEEAIKQFYQSKMEPPKVEWQEGVPYLVNPRSPTAPVVPAPGFAQPEARPPLTYGGQTFTPPPGLSGAARKKWETDVAGAIADAATGKQTEAQAKATRFADRMVEAERLLQPLETSGTSQTRKALEGVPGGLGNWLQSGASQSYNTAKGAWIAGHLRADSGAVINPDEFARADRDFFPQPGDSARQIEEKRQRRAVETEAMQKSAGLGYKPPSPRNSPDGAAPPSPAATAGPAASDKKTIGGKSYSKRNGQWFED